ncbi:exodeoxyribonuclease VII large subunit [Coriobacteriia bacterium Es71-Z0120]|uniref:exodeoxyribonuclease VII large subunit n=1 Tax=Parvivirga hydrogeniphila TaxID=2939460 RepID=UPI002260AB38|nr:exodeoxyribonuclease VII large subunit [Parvivirga hydrogeniphila]MCL4078916.1 exodeoxyribonuclease VII large subunit [Parvivirga hydrogeniphila]
MNDKALSVSEALSLAKAALDAIAVRVIGEVTEATSKPGYKAVYFTLADDRAAMPCLMWRDAYEACGFELRQGMLVEAVGTFTVYVQKGRMQFQVRSMAPAGEGVLRMQVAALARRLEAEGLMSAAIKRSLPPYPDRIGVVTSPRGKAVHDVLRTLKRRYPAAEVVIAGVQVEGDGAVDAIVEGLRRIGEEPGVDVVILCRGGGSYEDLMPFNDERVARAIRACPVPVVTGIGHEPDVSIADLVADVHASTPTAAAEAAAPSAAEVLKRFDEQQRLLARALRHGVQRQRHRLEIVAQKRPISDPRSVLSSWMQALDDAASGLAAALPARIAREHDRLDAMRRSLADASMCALERARSRYALGERDLMRAGPRLFDEPKRQVGLYAARLDGLSPLKTLGRGYAVCYADATGRIVRSVDDVAPRDELSVRVSDGRIACEVRGVEKERT